MLVKIRRIIAPTFASVILVNECGSPRYWAAVWASYLPAELSKATLIRKLRTIDRLYNYTDQYWRNGHLDDALSNFNIPMLFDVIEGYFLEIQNSGNLNTATEEAWQTGLQFVIDICRRITRNQSGAERIADFEARFRTLEFQSAHLYIGAKRRPERVRSLPANVLEHLYRVLDPESPNNPFVRWNTKWRVWMFFTLLLHQGLRHGEALVLSTDAVKCAFDHRRQSNRFWMNVNFNEYEDDPRYSEPSIKNSVSVRQVPVSQIIAQLIQEYVENHRGRANHSFLFNSQKHTPLSKEGVKGLFKKISGSLPVSLQKELQDHAGADSITPHQLRHTCAVVRLNQLLSSGVETENALQQLRTFFGWSRESDMPLRYARAVFENRLNSVWNSQFDEHVAILSAIPPRLA